MTGSFTYDGNLKRVKQVMDGETIYSVYDASGAMVYRDNQSTGKKTAYFSAGGAGIRAEQGGAVIWTHNDHLGSPVAERSSNGAINWREKYTPYGEKLVNPAANKDKTGPLPWPFPAIFCPSDRKFGRWRIFRLRSTYWCCDK